ncbi:MAG: hypothetical protein Q7R54_01600 [bacterium]|nr:hypothetical protein [bacterium]
MKYEVYFEPFTERHFIRTFTRKYKGAWDRTLKGLILEFIYVDFLFDKTIAEPITDKHADIVICKTEFKIAGTEVSRHASGNRCIIAVRKSTAVVHVLLVYSKGDIGDSNETATWKAIIKDNYPEYRKFL